MVDNQDSDRILLGYQWEDFKRRFGVAAFIDDDGNPVDEGALTDHDKQVILARYTVHREHPALIDVTPERKPSRRMDLLRRVLQRFRGRGRARDTPVWQGGWYLDRGLESVGD